MTIASQQQPLTFRVLFPFCGLGAGALGFLEAQPHLFGHDLRFEAMGGIDLDPAACADFEYLTGAPAWCTDVTDITPDALRARYGAEAPDCVFMSPPCKGASGLLSKAKAKTEKYQAMNELALIWTRLMLATWGAAPPRLVLLENVPRLATRAAAMLTKIRSMLRAAGYRLHEGYHDCGEIGGLAQHRRRYLLVARHAASCEQLLYQPPKKRVRACGEVLETLPVPATPEAAPFGRLHQLPKISWLNWVRLALIPAGGDWRDLEGVLAEGQERREQWKRHEVSDWQEPTGVVSGGGSNAVANVADPRTEPFGNVNRVTPWAEPVGTITKSPAPSSGAAAVADPRTGPFHNVDRVRGWDEPTGAVTAAMSPRNGAQCAADPRLDYFRGYLGVNGWDAPVGVVTGSARPGTGNFSVADPRPDRFKGSLGVTGWEEPSGAVTGESHPSNGKFAVADPRITCEPRAGAYGVLGWEGPAKAVTGVLGVDNGRAAVADPRVKGPLRSGSYGVQDWNEPSKAVRGAFEIDQAPAAAADPRVKYAYDAGYAVLDWREAARTVAGKSFVGCGAYAVADPREIKLSDAPGRHWSKYRVEDWSTPAHTVHGAIQPGSGGPSIADPRKPPPFLPVIIAADGTWHRPLTTLELAILQGIPHIHRGEPLRLHGNSQSAWRERIGNAVPVQAGTAIGTCMLVTLAHSRLGTFALDNDEVWVMPDGVSRGGITLQELAA